MRVRSLAPPTPAADPLAIAAGIGAGLVRDAVWYRGRCNWVGAERGRAAHRALGPALGEGSAGVALFLAQLHAVTADAAVRRTALAAIGQALAQAGDAPPAGLFDGRLGIAYAAARCAGLLGDEGLRTRAVRLARARGGAACAGDHTVASGTAGSIAALLALARIVGDERLAARAAPLGDDLVAAARRERHGWSWPAPGAPRDHGLCGLPLGAGGAAWALLELHAVTGDARHRDAARRALAYDRHWGDSDPPDLRGVSRGERRGTFRTVHPATWAHGAPGIALVRLRAHALEANDSDRAQAAAALAATAARLEADLPRRGADFTLAHGLAGRADVLVDSTPAHAELARRSGDAAAGRHATSVEGWPCGVGDGLAPALLTGHAGIGLFYLRLHDPAIASPLLPT